MYLSRLHSFVNNKLIWSTFFWTKISSTNLKYTKFREKNKDLWMLETVEHKNLTKNKIAQKETVERD